MLSTPPFCKCMRYLQLSSLKLQSGKSSFPFKEFINDVFRSNDFILYSEHSVIQFGISSLITAMARALGSFPTEDTVSRTSPAGNIKVAVKNLKK